MNKKNLCFARKMVLFIIYPHFSLCVYIGVGVMQICMSKIKFLAICLISKHAKWSSKFVQRPLEGKIDNHLGIPIWQFLMNLNIHLPYDPVIPILNINPKEIKIYPISICAQLFIGTFLLIA